MARRHRAEMREMTADPKYNDKVVSHLINQVMRDGKKSVAVDIVYSTLEIMKEKAKSDNPLELLYKAIDNAKPRVEVKSRRVGGATYQVPVEVSSGRQMALALRWIIGYAHARKGVPMKRALALELLDAYQEQGNAVKKRDDTHKMAQANKAFAHYRW
ncbi:MAG: 30S ribosomal protein S7 [Kiritimatiellia bacterium]